MFKKFCKHIDYNGFFKSEERILIAVSGGIDSMLLCRYMRDAGFSYAIAHVDHHTREGASTRDAAFVKAYCQRQGVAFHRHNIQHSAADGNFHDFAHRERYAFFDSLGYDKILTAHHQDDHVETVMINLLNGRSAEGILSVNGKIVRPLLPFTKAEIVAEAQRLEVEYVEDASNSHSDYLRNLLRNEIFPLLDNKLPDYATRLKAFSQKNIDDQGLLKVLVTQNIHPQICGRSIEISKADLVRFEHPSFVFHALRAYGINRSMAADLYEALDKVGGQFLTATHHILVDRSAVIIRPSNEKATPEKVEVRLDKLPISLSWDSRLLRFDEVKQAGETTSQIAYFPISSLDDSLIIRPWQTGDKLKPFGMNGQRKSLKKLFVDYKINQFDKHRIPLLINGPDIIWAVGLRVSQLRATEESIGPFLRVSYT